MRHPADLYLSLQDDGDGTAAAVPAGRRVAALCFAVLLLAAAPLLWVTSDAVATSGPKAALSHDGDDDNSGPGGGDGDDTADTGDTGTQTRTRGGTQTNSNTATRTGKTGVSTKQPTQTNSNTATSTGKTGASTRVR